MVRFTVYSSSTSIRATSPTLARLGDFWLGSSTRSKVKRTASALNGSPLWKTTPRRSLSCQVVSFSSRQDSASSGTMRLSRSRPTSESNRLAPTVARIDARFIVGSRFSGVHGIATRSSPRGSAAPARAAPGQQGDREQERADLHARVLTAPGHRPGPTRRAVSAHLGAGQRLGDRAVLLGVVRLLAKRRLVDSGHLALGLELDARDREAFAAAVEMDLRRGVHAGGDVAGSGQRRRPAPSRSRRRAPRRSAPRDWCRGRSRSATGTSSCPRTRRCRPSPCPAPS